MASLIGKVVFALDNGTGYKAWEDPSFIKWRKRDAHVTLRCHESVEGDNLAPVIFQSLTFCFNTSLFCICFSGFFLCIDVYLL